MTWHLTQWEADLYRDHPWPVGPYDDVLLDMPVKHLEVSVRVENCFKHFVFSYAGEFTEVPIVYVGDLIQLSEAQLLRIVNFGRKSLNEIKEVLAQHGLQLSHTCLEGEEFVRAPASQSTEPSLMEVISQKARTDGLYAIAWAIVQQSEAKR